jgi:hypothetical protein
LVPQAALASRSRRAMAAEADCVRSSAQWVMAAAQHVSIDAAGSV